MRRVSSFLSGVRGVSNALYSTILNEGMTVYDSCDASIVWAFAVLKRCHSPGKGSVSALIVQYSIGYPIHRGA